MVVEAWFYGGAGTAVRSELGGVQLLLRDIDWDTSFFIDFGIPPDRWSYLYGFPYRPPPSRLLNITQYFSLVPKIDGIYRADYEKLRGRKNGPCPVQGCLVTHEHYDHIGALGMLRKEYLS